MIDRLVKELQERLDQVLSEAERLRKALAALDPRGGSGSDSGPPARSRADGARRATASGGGAASGGRGAGTGAGRRSTGASSRRSRVGAATAGSGSARSSQSASRRGRTRTAPGATKAAVISALAGAGPKTAGEVAEATGLARGTVSTTLSKLARGGEVVKAARGYALPERVGGGELGSAGSSRDGAGASPGAPAAESTQP